MFTELDLHNHSFKNYCKTIWLGSLILFFLKTEVLCNSQDVCFKDGADITFVFPENFFQIIKNIYDKFDCIYIS